MIDELTIEASQLQPGDTVIEINGNVASFDVVKVEGAGFSLTVTAETVAAGRYRMHLNRHIIATVIR